MTRTPIDIPIAGRSGHKNRYSYQVASPSSKMLRILRENHLAGLYHISAPLSSSAGKRKLRWVKLEARLSAWPRPRTFGHR